MVIGCGGLLFAGAIVRVAAAFAVEAECPPPAVCGEGGPLSLLVAMPVVLLGTVIALAGLFSTGLGGSADGGLLLSRRG